MKKLITLLVLISLLICSLCSCQLKNITVGEVTGDLYFKENREGFNTIVFDGTPYNIYTPNLKGFYFYKSTDEFITYVWGGRFNTYGLYKVNNPDFGTAFVATEVIMRLLGTPLSHPSYYLSGNTSIPELETIAIEDIVHVTTGGFFTDIVYTEWSNVDELTSSISTKSFDRSWWNSENDTVLLGEIIDFSNPILLPEKFICYDSIVFIPRDYESFFCGPFKVIWTNGGEFYLKFSLSTDDEYIYKVQDKYQDSFDKRYEHSSREWDYILGEDTPKSE